MRYVALRDFPMHLERVKMRADASGHSAPESVLRTIYESCGATPKVLLQADNGEVICLAEEIPDWLARTVAH
jgi:predicted ABC-type ATPase